MGVHPPAELIQGLEALMGSPDACLRVGRTICEQLPQIVEHGRLHMGRLSAGDRSALECASEIKCAQTYL